MGWIEQKLYRYFNAIRLFRGLYKKETHTHAQVLRRQTGHDVDSPELYQSVSFNFYEARIYVSRSAPHTLFFLIWGRPHVHAMRDLLCALGPHLVGPLSIRHSAPSSLLFFPTSTSHANHALLTKFMDIPVEQQESKCMTTTHAHIGTAVTQLGKHMDLVAAAMCVCAP